MYILQELQTSEGQTAVTPAVTNSDPGEAERAYLLACADACVSSVPIHTVICMDEFGNHVFDSPRSWKHEQNI